MSLKPICVPCQRFFRPDKNGVYFTEGMPMGSNAPPGTAAPDRWQPYKIWHGDRWRCPGCEAIIIVGVGREPVREHYQDGFAAMRRDVGADKFQVNDC